MDTNKDSNSNSPGYDEEELVSTKIPPLDSPSKSHVGHEHTHGVIGEDYILQSSHIDPFQGSNGRHGTSQKGGHHGSHHQRRDQHQQQHSTENKSPKQGDEGLHEGSTGLGIESPPGTGTGLSGMKVREKVVEHIKGGMPMRSED